MQILECPQPKVSVSSSVNQTVTRSKLSMIWVSELNNGHQRLVAKWVKQAVEPEM